MWKAYGCLGLSILLLAGCGSDPWVAMEEQQREYEQAQWHKARVEPLVAEVKHKYSAQQPGLIIYKAFNNVVLVAGEVDSSQAQKQVFDELSAIKHAKVHMFALVRQDASPKRRADDEALRAQVSELIPSYYELAVYVVDGRVGVVGPLRTDNYETLRGILTDIERKVPGTRPDPYLVLTRHGTQGMSSPESLADLGDWAPKGLEVTPTLQPANLSGTVSSTKAWVDLPREPVRAAVVPVQTQPAASYDSGRSAAGSAGGGSGMAIWGGLLQAAGQIAQATGSTQGYESGLLMQGVGAVMAGDNTAAEQAVANAELYGESNRALERQQAAQQQQQYAQQQAAAVAEAARQHEWNMQNQRVLDSQRREDEAATASPLANLGISAADDVPSTSVGSSSQATRYSKPSNHCLSGSRNADGSISLHNTCNTSISVRYCYIQVVRPNQQQYTCRPIKDYWSKEGVTYATQDPGTVTPGGTMNIAPGGGSVAYVGCATPYIFPIISRVSSAEVRGYCVKS